MALLNPGGAIAQFQRNDCSISPVEVIWRGGVHRTLNAERKKVEKEVRELQMAQYFVDRAYGDAEKTEKEQRTVQR